MMEARLASFRALNCQERQALTAGMPLPFLQAAQREKEATQKLHWWNQQLNRVADEVFEWRRREFNLDRPGFVDILGASEGELASVPGVLPQWHHDLQHIYTLLDADYTPEKPGSITQDSMLGCVWAWLAWAENSLLANIEALTLPAESGVDAKGVARFLLPSLRSRYRELLQRTLILELNVARAKGELQGDSGQERYAYFLKHLVEPARTFALFSEYPVLARILTVEARRWVESSVEMVARLAEDWDRIKHSFFDGASPGPIKHFYLGAGDRHLGGRTVTVIEFERSAVVYKPRRMVKDTLFGEIILLLEAEGAALKMHSLRILDRGEYGWCEFVRHQPCLDDAEMSRFYRRAGQLLGLLFSLHATDIHYENLIAAGENPVIIDLECLLARMPIQHWRQTGSILEYAWGETLLSTHLLPSARAGGPDGPELSGLNGPNDGKLTPLPVITWERAESDEMRVVRKRIPFQEGGRINLPGSASARNFVPEICAGFREVAEKAGQWGGLLLSSPVWQQICGEESRYIAWRSMNYAKLLQDGCHPNLLRDAMDREAFFDALWGRDLQEEVKDPIIRSERQDLWNEDIPVFFSRPQDAHIYSHNGARVPIHGFETTQAAATRRLTSFTKDAIERHCWTIKTAFRASSQVTAARLLDADVWKPKVCPEDALETTCSSVARQIADRLLSLAFVQDGQIFWVDTLDIPVGQDRLVFAGPTSAELYSGLSGFLLFFNAAAERFGDQRYRDACSAIARTISPILRRRRKAEAPFLGGFIGDFAALYAASHVLAADPEQTELRAACEAALDSVEQVIPNDKAYDIVGGSAGAIGALLSLHSATGNNRCLELAQLAGEHLLRSAVSVDRGVAWRTIGNSVPLSGFAHGSSGIAHALFYLSKATRFDGYAEMAQAAVVHDRSAYSPEHQNWLDLRDHVTDRDFVGWCYGAPGVGLSRLAQMQFGYGDNLCEKELEIAVNKTLHANVPAHHLCHGAFGNIEFVLLAAERSRRTEWRQAADLMIKRALEQIMDLGFLGEGDSEVLNLMLGLCGVGHVLLRVAFAQPMPDVLLLEPPRSRESKQDTI